MKGHHFIGHGNVHHQPPHSFLASTPLPTFNIFCQAEDKCSLTIRDGNVVLASSNPNDPLQHWIKDMRHSTRIKDEEGFPAFALVNKATGQAIKHSLGQSHPVRLLPFNPDYLDESVLWTESRDVGNGFRCIRMVNNSILVIDAHIDGEEVVHDGTTIVLWNWCKGTNQSWKIVPYGDEFISNLDYIPTGIYTLPGANPAYCRPFGGTVKIYCSANEGYNLTIRNDTVVLGTANPRDPYQHWIKDLRYSTRIKDEEGYPAFALVNQVTGKALKHSLGQSHPVGLVPFNPDYLDESVLWTESKDVGHGFRCIRMVNNIYLNFDADVSNDADKPNKEVQDGTNLILYSTWGKTDNQLWTIVPWCKYLSNYP
ncbi:Ricin-type beta-trefoil lectin domain-like protein [Carex littledalei]|uniref:Ricin-type beta-trefoil lectin domain-like protein n=1 Tax=Carex littledalei TaxID=544730 RepID=A0A833RB81_9POAL|nr:Ricin-type beta-trefoil lectin domain-like protein [Carex littledalei]